MHTQRINTKKHEETLEIGPPHSTLPSSVPRRKNPSEELQPQSCLPCHCSSGLHPMPAVLLPFLLQLLLASLLRQSGGLLLPAPLNVPDRRPGSGRTGMRHGCIRGTISKGLHQLVPFGLRPRELRMESCRKLIKIGQPGP